MLITVKNNEALDELFALLERLDLQSYAKQFPDYRPEVRLKDGYCFVYPEVRRTGPASVLHYRGHTFKLTDEEAAAGIYKGWNFGRDIDAYYTIKEISDRIIAQMKKAGVVVLNPPKSDSPSRLLVWTIYTSRGEEVPHKHSWTATTINSFDSIRIAVSSLEAVDQRETEEQDQLTAPVQRKPAKPKERAAKPKRRGRKRIDDDIRKRIREVHKPDQKHAVTAELANLVDSNGIPDEELVRRVLKAASQRRARSR